MEKKPSKQKSAIEVEKPAEQPTDWISPERRAKALELAVKAYHETDSRPTIKDILDTAATFDKFLKGEKNEAKS